MVNIVFWLLGAMLGTCITSMIKINECIDKKVWDDTYIKHYDMQLEESLKAHGVEAQVRQYAEEASELTIALNKWLRNDNDVTYRPQICEEVADVMIMLRQVKIMCNLEDEDINSIVSYKINREMKRIKNEKI